MENLLSVTEMAAKLGLNAETVRRLVRSNKLPHLRVGKSIRFRLSDVATAQAVQEFDPREYVEELINNIRNAECPMIEDVNFKQAHAEGATAVLREMGIFTTTECEAWRSVIRSAAKFKISRI
jgi:excisionase family DNA binding protein